MNRKNITQKWLFPLLRLIAFFALVTFLLHMSSLLFMPKFNKSEDGNVQYISKGYAGEENYTLDYFAVGNSNLYRGLAPMQLWAEHGLAGYASGLPGRDVSSAYPLLKDMFEKQQPRLVILEMDFAFDTGKSSKSSPKKKVRKILRTLRKNLMDFPANTLNDGIGTALSYVFPIVKNHSRWKSMSKTDFAEIKASRHYAGKGFVASGQAVPYPGGFDYMKHTGKKEKISASALRNLDKIIRLCEKNHSQLLLVVMPSASSWSSAKHQSLVQFAQDKDLPLIDFNTMGEEIGFDWKTDTKDGGNHLNLYGAQKTSRYLGNYIQQHDSLPDRRNDPAYQQWHQDAKQYQKIKQEQLRQDGTHPSSA